MDRAEVVAALREAYEQGGMRLLSAIADDIREHGQLHDEKDWLVCVDCGEEFAERSHEMARSNPDRCEECWRRHHYEQSKKHNRSRWYF